MLKLTAVDNNEDSPLLSKPVSLHTQCNEENSKMSLLTDKLVVIDTFRKR